MTLTWTILKVSDWNGFAKGYNITYYPYGEESAIQSIPASNVESSTVLKGLKMFTNYEIFIRAVTGAGEGQRSGCVRKTQEGGM